MLSVPVRGFAQGCLPLRRCSPECEDDANSNSCGVRSGRSRFHFVPPGSQRYRLHEALERVAEGKVLDWATFALNLGYTDQAHFIRDFKLGVGTTPDAFARSDPLRAAAQQRGCP